MTKKWGEQQARKIQQRLDDLRAASSLEIMRDLPDRCHEFTGDLQGNLSLDLVHPFRLLFIPADEPLPKKSDGGLDWSKVKTVKIIGVEDTHGS